MSPRRAHFPHLCFVFLSAGLPSISFATRLLHPPQAAEDPYGASSTPIYQTATFAQVFFETSSSAIFDQHTMYAAGGDLKKSLELQYVSSDILENFPHLSQDTSKQS